MHSLDWNSFCMFTILFALKCKGVERNSRSGSKNSIHFLHREICSHYYTYFFNNHIETTLPMMLCIENSTNQRVTSSKSIYICIICNKRKICCFYRYSQQIQMNGLYFADCHLQCIIENVVLSKAVKYTVMLLRVFVQFSNAFLLWINVWVKLHLKPFCTMLY